MCLVTNVALYAAASLQVHVNCSTPMFQHSAEPSKSFLHTKIYSSPDSIVFLLLISQGSHVVTVSSSPTLFTECLAHFTLMSLWSLMMSVSHVTKPLTEPQSQHSLRVPTRPALISPRPCLPNSVTGRCGADPRWRRGPGVSTRDAS